MSGNPLGLRPFQLTAVDHLALRPDRLLADDPGLGKTFMAGELDRLARTTDKDVAVGYWKPTLVICPKALLYTWGEWFARYRPEERAIVIDPRSPKAREPFRDALLNRSHSVYIVHYEGMKMLLGVLKDIEFLHIILDEAHRIANRKTQTSKAARVLKAVWRTALTGTAASKAPDQAWAILNFLDRRAWSSYWAYRTRYVEVEVDPRGYSKVVGAKKEMLPELRQRLAPMMVRRRKADVLPELPAKTYKNVWVDLSPKQRKLYDQMRDKMLAWVGEHEDEPLQASVVIAQLIRLQQIALATPTFVTVTKRVRQYWTDEHGKPLTDREGNKISAGLDLVDEEVVEVHLDEPSSKLDAAMEIIHDLVDQDQQVVVFSQFTRMIDLLEARLKREKVSVGKYTGQTRHTTRTQIEKDFADHKLSVFAGQFQAGGVGLNLQTASTVIFLDAAWTARDNLQAEDRIHRMGQLAQQVNVIYIMARGTVDRGRFQGMAQSWHGIQQMLGDTTFDWEHSLVEEEEENL